MARTRLRFDRAGASSIGRTLGTLRTLVGYTRADDARRSAFRDGRLRDLVRHAFENVAFHREAFDRTGVHPGAIRGVADLHRLPVTDRGELRARRVREALARGAEPRRLVVRYTSGATGRPFTVLRTQTEDHLLHLFRRRAHRMAGRRRGDRGVIVMEPALEGRRGGALGRLERALGGGRTSLDCFQPAEWLVREMARLRPDVIGGYPSALARLAGAMEPERPAGISPRYVWTGGENLDAAQRAAIEAAFGAPVVDFYGAHEFNLVAWECPDTGRYHVCDDNVILEVLGEDGGPVPEGETGHVVVTGLHTWAMPFLRYRLGDLAVRGEARCPCGAPFSVLRGVRGRGVEWLHLPDGRSLHPFQVTDLLTGRGSRWTGQHQLEQEAKDRVVLRLALRREPPPGELDALRAAGREVLGDGVAFRVERVEGFAREASGKFRPYIGLDRPPAPFAEHEARPAALLVHEPGRHGGWDARARLAPEALERDALFRSHPEPARFAAQHAALVQRLRDCGVRVLFLEELVGSAPAFRAARALPNGVYARDPLITLPWRPRHYIAARMAEPLRRPETAALEAAMRALGLRELLRLPEDLVLEGGDAVPFRRGRRRTLLVGTGPRTRPETLDFLQQVLLPEHADEILGVELAEWRINLDGGLLPVADDVVLAEPESLRGGVLLGPRGRTRVDVLDLLREEGMRVVEVSREESVQRQACNAVCLGDREIVVYDLCPRVRRELEACDLRVHAMPGSELVKGRGGPRCLTRPLYALPSRWREPPR